jgi:hypothetical protein
MACHKDNHHQRAMIVIGLQCESFFQKANKDQRRKQLRVQNRIVAHIVDTLLLKVIYLASNQICFSLTANDHISLDLFMKTDRILKSLGVHQETSPGASLSDEHQLNGMRDRPNAVLLHPAPASAVLHMKEGPSLLLVAEDLEDLHWSEGILLSGDIRARGNSLSSLVQNPSTQDMQGQWDPCCSNATSSRSRRVLRLGNTSCRMVTQRWFSSWQTPKR